ncbi:hypothetical protein HYS93_00705 [Candidatus Daviesbacteria bacterium]|nr:hypothetical protein [Candidatus Daviesbacteria bacterium]
MHKHLAIFSKDAIKQIFSGKKSWESRFSQKKIAPFATVSVGDIVFIKPPGEDILGQFRVKKVIYFEGLDDKDWEVIKAYFTNSLSFGTKRKDKDYFTSKKSAKFGTLLAIDRVEQFITSPVKIPKKDLRGWVVLD